MNYISLGIFFLLLELLMHIVLLELIHINNNVMVILQSGILQVVIKELAQVLYKQ